VRADAPVTAAPEKSARLLSLAAAMLQYQGAAGGEMGGRAGYQGAQFLQAVPASYQRPPRFETEVSPLQVRVAWGDIRGIADDQVEAHSPQGGVPVPPPQPQVSPARAPAVGRRDPQGAGANVRRQHLGGGALAGQRYGDRAAARAEVGDPRGRARGDQLQRRPYYFFGLGTGDQRMRVDPQRQRPEFPQAGKVGDGPAQGAPGQQRPEPPRRRRRHRHLRVRVQSRPARGQDAGQQQFRLQPGAPVGPQYARRGEEQRAHGGGMVPRRHCALSAAALSAWAWYSLISGSITASILPSSTSPSWCRVSWMR